MPDTATPPVVGFVTMYRFRDGTALLVDGGAIRDDGCTASADAVDIAAATNRTDVAAVEVWRGEFRPYFVARVKPSVPPALGVGVALFAGVQ